MDLHGSERVAEVLLQALRSLHAADSGIMARPQKDSPLLLHRLHFLAPILSSALALALAAPPVSAHEPETADHWYSGHLEFGTGFDYSEGDYGFAQDTRIWYVPFSVGHRFTNLAFRDRDRSALEVTLPWLQVRGPDRGSVLAPNRRGTDRGIGDLLVEASYDVVPESDHFPVATLSGTLKVPTASESDDLGDGEFDFTPELMLSHHFPLDLGVLRAFNPYASAGYEYVGDSDRDDAWLASVGASALVGTRLLPGLHYSFQQSTLPGRGDSHTLSPSLGFYLNHWLDLTPYATIGLSTRSPDWGVGLAVRLTRWIP